MRTHMYEGRRTLGEVLQNSRLLAISSAGDALDQLAASLGVLMGDGRSIPL